MNINSSVEKYNPRNREKEEKQRIRQFLLHNPVDSLNYCALVECFYPEAEEDGYGWCTWILEYYGIDKFRDAPEEEFARAVMQKLIDLEIVKQVVTPIVDAEFIKEHGDFHPLSPTYGDWGWYRRAPMPRPS